MEVQNSITFDVSIKYYSGFGGNLHYSLYFSSPGTRSYQGTRDGKNFELVKQGKEPTFSAIKKGLHYEFYFGKNVLFSIRDFKIGINDFTLPNISKKKQQIDLNNGLLIVRTGSNYYEIINYDNQLLATIKDSLISPSKLSNKHGRTMTVYDMDNIELILILAIWIYSRRLQQNDNGSY